MAIDKIDGGAADMIRREMESRNNEVLEDAQRERMAVDSAAQQAQEISAEGKIGDGSDLAKVEGAEQLSGENHAELAESDPNVASTASDQQDRGENWTAFSAEGDDSLGRAAREKDINSQLGDDSSEQQSEAAKKVQVSDLLKEMAIQSGRIKS